MASEICCVSICCPCAHPPHSSLRCKRLKLAKRLCLASQCVKTCRAAAHHAHRNLRMANLRNAIRQAICPRHCSSGPRSLKPQRWTACLGASSLHMRDVTCCRCHVAPLACFALSASNLVGVCMSLLYLNFAASFASLHCHAWHIDITRAPCGEERLIARACLKGETQTLYKRPQCSERPWTRRRLGRCKCKRLILETKCRKELA